jgi:ribosome-associated toxin RatA of RatAB toxin-antitoxin module
MPDSAIIRFLPWGSVLSQIERTIALPYTREQLYNLVSDVPSYPQFVPYCVDAKVLSDNQGVVDGSLRVGYKGLGYTFATRNINHPHEHIHMALLSGPFQRLEGDWYFDHTAGGCQVRLRLTIIFKNPLLSMMFKGKIDELTDMMVTAFVQRARDMYK